MEMTRYWWIEKELNDTTGSSGDQDSWKVICWPLRPQLHFLLTAELALFPHIYRSGPSVLCHVHPTPKFLVYISQFALIR